MMRHPAPKAGALTRLSYAPSKRTAGFSDIEASPQAAKTRTLSRIATQISRKADTAFAARSWADAPIRSRGIYLDAYVPGHPMADKRGRVLLHRLVASETVGRALRPDEHVHHINGNPRDNRPGNLEIVSPAAHNARHPQKTKPHGAPRRYRAGCRCDLCKEGQSLRMRRYRAAKADTAFAVRAGGSP